MEEESIVVKARFGFTLSRAEKLIVRIEGVRLDSPPRWNQYTEEQAVHNNAFWAQAHSVK